MKEIKDVSELAGLPVGTEVKFGDLEFSVEKFLGPIAGSECANCVVRLSRGECVGVPCGGISDVVYLPITKKAEKQSLIDIVDNAKLPFEVRMNAATYGEYHTTFIAQNPKNIETARGLLAELMNTETDKDKQLLLQKIYELI